MRERSTMLVPTKREQRAACYGTFSPRQHQSKNIHWQVEHYTGLKKLVLEEDTTIFLHIWPQSIGSVQAKNIKEKSSPYQSWDFNTPLAGEDRSRKLGTEQQELSWIPCSLVSLATLPVNSTSHTLRLMWYICQARTHPRPKTSFTNLKEQTSYNAHS